MELTPEQAFKVGFLYRCAEEGLTIAETHQRVKLAIQQVHEKRGAAGMSKEALIGGALAGLGSLAGGAATLGGRFLGAIPGALSALGLAGVGVPVVAGAGTGYLAARATSPDGKSLVEDAKRDEIIDEYERLAEEARRRARIKKLQAQTGKRIVPLSPSLGSGY